MPWVTIDIANYFMECPSRKEFLKHYIAIMQKHDIRDAVHIAHSYGNCILSQILQDPIAQFHVSRCVCIDPVPMHNFRFFAHHFFYRWLCPLMDAPTSITMHRHSFWYDDSFVASMLPEDSLVIVGSKDPMIDADALERDVHGPEGKRLGLSFLLLPGFTHLTAFLSRKSHALVRGAISQVINAHAQDAQKILRSTQHLG